MSLTFDLLALDVDGTLLDERHQVSSRLRTELSRARALGVRLCLCTGRPYAAITSLLHDLQINTPPVVFNGALVPCLDDSKPLVSQPLHPQAVQQLIKIAHLTGFYLELHTATHCHVERLGFEGTWQMQKLGIEPIVGPFNHLAEHETILKGQFVIPDKRQREQMIALEQELDGAVFSWGLSPGFDGYFVNVMCPGVDKASSLNTLLEKLNIPWTRVFAAGDSPSDMAYVKQAGRGVMLSTMQNPVDKLQRSEDGSHYVAPPVQKDGLVLAMQKLFWSANSLEADHDI